MKTRRDFLKIAGILSGAAAVPGLIPDSIQRAYAIEPEPGSTFLDAEHVVILMQENRSFDHALGTLRGVRGFNDPRAIRLPNGNSVFVQTDAAGNSYVPWRLDIRDTRITWMGSIPHSRNSQVDAWNGGQHDGWVPAKRSHIREYQEIPITMGHYTREDLPFYYALADAFTVCDQNYCSVMTSTTPNRSYFWTGTIRDQQRADSMVYMRNEEFERGGGVPWKTYPERLQEAGVSWKFYQNELTHSGGLNKDQRAWLANFGCNVLEFFSAYNVDASASGAAGIQERIEALTQQAAELDHKVSSKRDPEVIAHLRSQIESRQKGIERLKAALPNSGPARYQQLTREQRALHDAAFVTNTGDPEYHSLEELAFEDEGKQQAMLVPKGDILYQFRKDVNDGKLPTVSWLTAPEKFSDHPTSPWYGAWYVSEILDILTKNPAVWKKTIFILTYDENDGYFDHGPSFVAADPKRPETGGASQGIDLSLEYTYADDELRQGVHPEEARSGPIGMGFRVPMIIASPWSRGGWVNSQLFDHTSTLMFLEHFLHKKYGKEVREENISNWRRAISGDLTSVFRRFDAQEAQLDFLNRDKFVISIERARYKPVPSNYAKLDSQQIADVNKNLLHSPLMPHQEPGIRPSCALPYELYADGEVNQDHTQFILRLKAGRAAGAPFNVYLRNMAENGKGMRVATYAVRPGDTLDEQFPLSLFAGNRYSIEVHGPNGFYRSFHGNAQEAGPQARLRYEQNGLSLTGNVRVNLQNADARALTVIVEDHSYHTGTIVKTLAAHSEGSIALNLQRSHGWYDFSVRAEGMESSARFAGRVETGRSSFSDPAMGGVV